MTRRVALHCEVGGALGGPAPRASCRLPSAGTTAWQGVGKPQHAALPAWFPLWAPTALRFLHSQHTAHTCFIAWSCFPATASLHSPSLPPRPTPSPQVVPVAEGYGTADALRAVASRITSRTFVVLSGDLLTDVPVGALVAQHNLHAGAMATMLLADRKVSPASETKPGKPPKVRGWQRCCDVVRDSSPGVELSRLYLCTPVGVAVHLRRPREVRGLRRAGSLGSPSPASCCARAVCYSPRPIRALRPLVMVPHIITTNATVLLTTHPQNVDYIGLDPSRQHLLFYASRPDALRDLKVGAQRVY